MAFIQSIFAYFYHRLAALPYLEYRVKYDIDKSFHFNGPDILFSGKGKIQCGTNGYVGGFSTIFSFPNTKVIIGKKCLLSYNVRIFSGTYVADADMSQESALKYGDVEIGDFCWIGTNVYIGQGVKIGENTVIGANSVVTKSIPPHCIAAGSPAKVIHFKSYLEPEKKKLLAKQYSDILNDSLKKQLLQ